MKKGENITKVSKDLGPLTLNYTITGLTATTTYTIEVSATTRVGLGVTRAADIQSGVPPGETTSLHGLIFYKKLGT